ncbi:MAG: calcium:proton antiporter [Pseudolabrys sp.]|nr:calcium:proton antiporter [Pseudolabrys sp.]
MNSIPKDWPHALAKEWFLALSFGTAVIFAVFGKTLLGSLHEPLWLTFIFAWLFAAVLGSALCVARHADRVAEILGEPYGTLVLTLSVTTIEVMSISAVMLHGDPNPTLVRDTLFAIVMLILGGMIGGSLLLGGWRNREMQYNLQGANSFLGVIIPLAIITLTLPSFTVTTPGPTLSYPQQIFVFVMSLGLYATFLALQTGRHRGYFVTDEGEGKAHAAHGKHSLAWHGMMLVAYILPVVFLAEQLAQPIDYVIETLKAPAVLGGVVIAALVATPEAIAATRAAMGNHLQRSINISLGSVLSTIGLTVPAMLAIGHFTGHQLDLGLSGANAVMLMLTLAVCVVTFASGRTNILQGAVHAMLFAAFVMLIFQG